jgi:hypothetical protein
MPALSARAIVAAHYCPRPLVRWFAALSSRMKAMTLLGLVSVLPLIELTVELDPNGSRLSIAVNIAFALTTGS